MLVRELGDEPRALPDLSLHDDGELAMGGERFEVQAGEKFELRTGGFHTLNFLFGAIEETTKGGVDGFAQDVVFIFEVEIDGAVGHSGPGRNFRNAGVEKSVFSDYLYGSVENALMLVAAARRLKRGDVRIAIDGLRGRRWTLQTETLGTSSAGLHNLLTNLTVAKKVRDFLSWKLCVSDFLIQILDKVTAYLYIYMHSYALITCGL